MTTLFSLYDKYKDYLQPDCWWKSKRNTSYQYRKILKVEERCHCIYVHYRDSILDSHYRLDYFLENHTPVTSKWEIFYAKVNYLTSGLFY